MVDEPDRRELPHGRDAGPADEHVYAVTGERAEHRWHQGLVVLEAAPVQDLQREKGGAERAPNSTVKPAAMPVMVTIRSPEASRWKRLAAQEPTVPVV